VIHYEVPPGTDDLKVAVYNLRGRLVRVLSSGPVEAAPGRLEWNGRDETGRPVASGVYFVRATSGAAEVSRKLVLLR
jgi:flagellar hook assembly protein FlgD